VAACRIMGIKMMRPGMAARSSPPSMAVVPFATVGGVEAASSGVIASTADQIGIEAEETSMASILYTPLQEVY
jgi:hypothetical protein